VSKKWVLKTPDFRAVESLLACGYSRVLSILLANRGIIDAKLADDYLKGALPLNSPMLLKDINKAVYRIEKAIKSGERIIIYGDYDVDGVTSTALLLLYLRSRGANVGFYIPQRQGEGYGLNAEAIKALHKAGTSIIITVDTGISATKEAVLAKELGIDLIVTDHHEPCEEIVEAYAVVNPKQLDCPYPFKDLAGVGVAFKLVCAIEAEEKTTELFERFGELVTLGTVADVVPLNGENRVLVMRGLELLSRQKSKGLCALFNVAGIKDNRYSSQMLSFTVSPRINASGRMASATDALLLLTANDDEVAASLANKLDEYNKLRQNIENEIFLEAVGKIDKTSQQNPVIVVQGEGWHNGVIGIVASRITARYGKPSVVVSFEGEIGRASCRSVQGFNIHEALCECSQLLIKFGGHEQAAGFSINRCNYEDFCEAINAFSKAKGEIPSLEISLDCVLEERDLEILTARECKKIEPCGSGNEDPLFLISSARICSITPLKEGRHLRLELKKGHKIFKAMLFGAEKMGFCFEKGDLVDLAATLDLNLYNGGEYLSIIIRDIALSQFEQRKRLYLKYAASGEAPEGLEVVIPSRSDFKLVYLYIKGCNGEFEPELACEKLYTTSVFDSFKFFLILNVFKELKLISYTEFDNKIQFDINLGLKIDLEKSILMRRISDYLTEKTSI
jgi:single-stranded-DNA-specific exonuclease